MFGFVDVKGSGGTWSITLPAALEIIRPSLLKFDLICKTKSSCCGCLGCKRKWWRRENYVLVTHPCGHSIPVLLIIFEAYFLPVSWTGSWVLACSNIWLKLSRLAFPMFSHYFDSESLKLNLPLPGSHASRSWSTWYHTTNRKIRRIAWPPLLAVYLKICRIWHFEICSQLTALQI